MRTVGRYTHDSGIEATIELSITSDAARTAVELLATHLAMHVVAMNPRYVSRARVPPEVIARERAIAERMHADANGANESFFGVICLLEQSFLLEPSITVEQHVTAVGAQHGVEIEIVGMSRIATRPT